MPPFGPREYLKFHQGYHTPYIVHLFNTTFMMR